MVQMNDKGPTAAFGPEMKGAAEVIQLEKSPKFDPKNPSLFFEKAGLGGMFL